MALDVEGGMVDLCYEVQPATFFLFDCITA